jgi:hypothetical protein
MVKGQVNFNAFDADTQSGHRRKPSRSSTEAPPGMPTAHSGSPAHLPAQTTSVRQNPVPAAAEEAISSPLSKSAGANNLPQSSTQSLPSNLIPALENAAKLDAAKLKASQTAGQIIAVLARQPKSWRWSIICTGFLGLFGGVGVVAYFWLAGLPPLPNCHEITPLSPDAQRLYCAQETARSGRLADLLAGMTLVKNWSPSHPLYHDAQQALAQWSRLVILIARDKMNQNDFKGAMSALNQIPSSSPIYEEAQKTAADWQQQWQSGEAIAAKAAAAIKQQDWRSAFDQVTELGYLEHDYWRLQQADSLAKQILMQKESYEALKQAKKLAQKLAPEQLGEAMQILQTVTPTSEAWTEAQQLLIDWSQTLMQIALRRWQGGDAAGAMQLAQQVPLDLKLPNPAADLVKLSHAAQLVEASQGDARTSWRQIWGLLEATTGMKQIQPDSPFYAEAQAKLDDWQAQLQDLNQLQFASLIAGLGHKPAFAFAIEQAQKIAPNRRRYAQAQALTAAWRGQVEQLEDLPYLRQAQKFASTNQIPDLQRAIAQAQVIPAQRSIWSDVQSQIVAWQRQIETIEDKPLLDKAQALAKVNQLDAAIDTAAEIRPNRALYDQAQTAIAIWKDKIRQAILAEDQAILDRARSFAGSGQLTDGIATAAQISPGRPLYLEAQAAIGAWLRERDGMAKSQSVQPSLSAPSAPAPSATDSPPAAPTPGAGQ